MDSWIVLIIAGGLIGTFGTLIGAGGGFILVPVLMLTHPHLSTETITAISLLVVAVNAISGSVAYSRSRRIDYKAGLIFAAFTIPGSILGVYVTRFIPVNLFQIVFSLLLISMAVFLFARPLQSPERGGLPAPFRKGWKHHQLVDRSGERYEYSYPQYTGIFISVLVGFMSPLLGIGGGIVHVPAMVQWLQFPVAIATATSHFILAVMSVVSVSVHWMAGNYDDPFVGRLCLGLGLGVLPGAQLGAYLSHRLPTRRIVQILAVCLGIVGVRILWSVIR